jgi:hypothetical protein
MHIQGAGDTKKLQASQKNYTRNKVMCSMSYRSMIRLIMENVHVHMHACPTSCNIRQSILKVVYVV